MKKIIFFFVIVSAALLLENCHHTQYRVVTHHQNDRVLDDGDYLNFTPALEISNSESYLHSEENKFISSEQEPVSTFSADVDRASYSNIRRFLLSGQKPPEDAVRIEEMINYFQYDYAKPEGKDPIKITTELSECPWNPENQLLLIGLQAKKIFYENIPASHLVFLIDVSGSMDSEDKLPLLKSSFKLLADNLRDKDKISIVVYAGAAGIVLPPTSGKEKTKIMDAINNLHAGGSTAGGEGILLAYKTAEDNFIKGGNNRIILATDGDFNVGVSDNKELEKLITEKRSKGVFLTCLGFGTGNLQDSKMETLADKGNGNYSYIDNINEAKKVLIHEFGGTMFVVAKDVKIQIQFNAANVQAYRLIGYENRMLAKEDFKDDKKDAGDVGSGHSVTAIYEIIPTGIKSSYFTDEQGLKRKDVLPVEKLRETDMGMIKLRYKQPADSVSEEISQAIIKTPLKFESSSENLRFAGSVALSGLLLKNSPFKGKGTLEMVAAIAGSSLGKDEDGSRNEFVSLLGKMK